MRQTLLIIAVALEVHVLSMPLESDEIVPETLAQTTYNTGEHYSVASKVRLNGYDITKAQILTSGVNKHTLNYPDALSLCGDYYGAFTPISDSFAQGESAQAWANAKQSFLNGAWRCINHDFKDPKRFYDGADDTLNAITGKINAFIGVLPAGCASYYDLAVKNFDHFAAQPGVSFQQQGGAGSVEAYGAGHQAACDFARDHGMTKVNEALVMNGCASHFLSDQFAPGHQTNPRRAIDKHANSLSAGLAHVFKQAYSKWMHDEANQAGLTFTNAKGQTWRGYGDECNYMNENAQNRVIHQAALTASAQVVLDVAMDPTNAEKYRVCVADQGVKELTPITSKLWDINSLKANNDIMPMFKSEDGQTIRMRGAQAAICKSVGAHYDQFCNTQTDVYMGVDYGAPKDYPAAGPKDTCCNRLTGNTFPARQTKSICAEIPWLSTGGGFLVGAKHPKCTHPDTGSNKVIV